MQLKKPLAVVLAVALVGVLGGGAVASTTQAEPPDEQDTEFDREVIDPDDQLSGNDVDRAVELALNNDEIQRVVDDAEDVEVTVQALGDRTDVKVVFAGEEEGISATVDLEAERATGVVENVEEAGAAEMIPLPETGIPDDGRIDLQIDDATTITETESTQTDVWELPGSGDGEITRYTTSPETDLGDAQTRLIDENEALSPDERALVERLVTESNPVNGEIGPVDGDSEWDLTVSQYEDDFWVDTDDEVVRVELSRSGTDPVAAALVNLDQERVEEVVPIEYVDTGNAETIDIDSEDVTLHTDDEDGEQ